MDAAKLNEVERLRLENLSLKSEMARRELELFGLVLRAKYGGEAVQEIRLDGTVVMAPAEPAEQ
jgi:hypothetical protein